MDTERYDPLSYLHQSFAGDLYFHIKAANNAFYAIKQKQKNAGPDYKPLVTVTTATANGFLEIRVKDNGTGMTATVKDKIMQPFFTTKPTGEGTGLGLSLSYDIIVKGHNGKMEVDTKFGEGSEFRVLLPVG